MKQALKRHWPWLRKTLGIVYLGLVFWLLVRLAQTLDWSRVADSIRGLPVSTVLVAASMAVASHLVYSTFDLLGRRLTGHRLSVAKTMLITFVSYAGNLNFGSLIGAVGLRQRLYSRLGLKLGDIVRVAATSMVTNWLGFTLLAALLLISPVYEQFTQPQLPPSPVARTVGMALLVALGAYMALAVFSPGRPLGIGRVQITIPSARFALLQLAMSMANWLFMSAIIYSLLEGRIDFERVLFALMVAAIAGVITHVPAGLGVLEAGFVLLLGDQMNREALLGVLLAYRAVYYLMPLLPAVLVWVWIESHAKRHA